MSGPVFARDKRPGSSVLQQRTSLSQSLLLPSTTAGTLRWGGKILVFFQHLLLHRHAAFNGPGSRDDHRAR